MTCKNRLPYNLYCVGGDVKTLLNPIHSSSDVLADPLFHKTTFWSWQLMKNELHY